MQMRDFFKLTVAVLVSELAGIVGSLFTVPAIPAWYALLQKPELSPPNWIFGPVWTTLYFLMGVSAYLVWKKGLATKGVKIALSFFVLQLVLNTLWSMVFFGLHSPFLGFLVIILLLVSIVATAILFGKIDRTAGLLFIPYIAWVSFATYLNYSIWVLNY